MSQRKFSKLSNARVVILGGTSGIGFAIAEGALEYGASVVISSSTQNKLDNALSRLRSAYPDLTSRISGKTCDLSKEDTVEENLHALFKFATENGKKVDHIVTTAGGPGGMGKLADAKATDILGVGVTKYVGGVMIGKIAPQYMEGGVGNSITYTSGSLADKPIKNVSAGIGYAGALESMTRALAVDLAPIRVNIVSPGAILTELLQNMGAAMDEGQKSFASDNLLGVLGRPEDTAEAYLYLMKDRFITGQNVRTEGGRLLVGIVPSW